MKKSTYLVHGNLLFFSSINNSIISIFNKKILYHHLNLFYKKEFFYMYKFCTHCGAKMPNENAFCTNCGAKFSQIPTPQQNMAPTNINYNTSNSNTMPTLYA